LLQSIQHQLTAAGKTPTEEAWERLLQPAEAVYNKTVPSATPTATMGSMEWGLSAGNRAHQASKTQGPIALSLNLTAEELAMPSGGKVPVATITLRVAKSGVLCGTQDAEKTSILLAVASAHPTALQVLLTLASHARKVLTVEELESLLVAPVVWR